MAEEIQLEDIVYALATSPTFDKDGICFAARPTGLYCSQDGGNTWTNAYASLELEAPLTTSAVVVSPTFETDRSVFAGVLGGVLRSPDGGQTWNVASFASPPPFVTTLAISPDFARDGAIFAGSLEDGIFRSGDRGRTWAAWNFGLLDLNVLALATSPDYAQDETLFAGTESGIFRSTNGGRAWREVNFPIDWAPVLSLALSPNYAQDGLILAGTEAHGLFHSQDGGATWERLAEGLLTNALNIILLTPEYPARPDILVLHEDSLLVSRDRGETWASLETDSNIQAAAPESLFPRLTSVAAPQGLAPGVPLLLGLTDGSVLPVQL